MSGCLRRLQRRVLAGVLRTVVALAGQVTALSPRPLYSGTHGVELAYVTRGRIRDGVDELRLDVHTLKARVVLAKLRL